MACSFVAKKLLASTKSSSIPLCHHAAIVATNRRGFFWHHPTNTSIPDVYNRHPAKRIVIWMLQSMPHTLRRMTRVVSEDKVEAVTCDNDVVSIPEGLTYSLDIPGIEKIKETDEGLSVFIDLGLNEQGMNDFDEEVAKVKLNKKKEVNALLIEGYVQKFNLRNNYYSRVNLSPTQTENLCERSIKTEIKDGGLMLTIPWKQKQE